MVLTFGGSLGFGIFMLGELFVTFGVTVEEEVDDWFVRGQFKNDISTLEGGWG